MPNFYVIATPIGNLEDITLRALRILKEVDLILCEDTRVTKKLLDRYEISKPLLSYHAHSKLSKIKDILGEIENGKTMALVSDAGTPAISDPGSYLVEKIRESFPELPILSIPGPSALTAVLSVAGMPVSDFVFLGFLPHKKGRATLFEEIAASKRAVVFYESPHRIMKTLEALEKNAGPNRRVAIGREITKIYEELLSGTASFLRDYLEKNQEKIRGEFVVVVSPREAEKSGILP